MPTEEHTSPDIFQLGEEVIDTEGNRLGKIRARFERYVLVESGGLFSRAYYIPHSAINKSGGSLFVRFNKAELQEQGMTNVPDDLYNDVPEPGIPQSFSGVPKFAKRPLSPAQTGHYHYGRRWPGINTDAAGSYHREEVLPIPQKLVEAAEERHRKA
ncbi:MAG TPA: hypothetical protein VHD63_27035 [Ktedonobacteraceae bacterium]|nr:hypothetical protein [Ktedonobacteraceae bacterium]